MMSPRLAAARLRTVCTGDVRFLDSSIIEINHPSILGTGNAYYNEYSSFASFFLLSVTVYLAEVRTNGKRNSLAKWG